MAESHVITGPVSKHCELVSEAAHLHKEITRIDKEIKSIDVVIKLLDPIYNLRGLRLKSYRTKSSFFVHGEATKLVLDTMRNATEPLTTIEVVSSIAAKKGLQLTDGIKRSLRTTVRNALSQQRATGILKEAGREGISIRWALA